MERAMAMRPGGVRAEDRLVEGRGDRADGVDAGLELKGLHPLVERRVAGAHELVDARAVHAAVAAEVDVLDADRVVEEVAVGGVAEAGVLVLLVALLVGDGHALAGELGAGSGAHPS
jgi:hypothetical protein